MKLLNKWGIWILGGLGIIALAVPGLIYRYGLHGDWLDVTNRAEKLGQYGDFYGGLLNPVFSFFAFVALLFTVNLQREELRDARQTRKEAEVLAQIELIDNVLQRQLSSTVDTQAMGPRTTGSKTVKSRTVREAFESLHSIEPYHNDGELLWYTSADEDITFDFVQLVLLAKTLSQLAKKIKQYQELAGLTKNDSFHSPFALSYIHTLVILQGWNGETGADLELVENVLFPEKPTPPKTQKN